jgi:hypothetical protein
VQHAHTARYRLQASDCVTREQAGIRALPCCAKAVQGKLVSCSCLQVNLATAGCTGFVQCQYSQLQAALYARPVTHRNRHTDILQHVVLLDLLSCSSLQAVVFVAVRTGFVQHYSQLQAAMYARPK